jgi:hypothetical protein
MIFGIFEFIFVKIEALGLNITNNWSGTRVVCMNKRASEERTKERRKIICINKKWKAEKVEKKLENKRLVLEINGN